MSTTWKIIVVLVLILVLVVTVFLWRLAGKPYYRISLLGTDYIEKTEELSYANERLEHKWILIKKYKYSEDKLLIGFGGGSSVTNDYFAYGVSDEKRRVILPPKFQFIYTKTNRQNEPIVYGLPHVETGDEKMEYYKIINEKLVAIEEEDSW